MSFREKKSSIFSFLAVAVIVMFSGEAAAQSVTSCPSPPIRLLQDNTTVSTENNGILEGRLEVCINKAWGTVCDDYFTKVDAVVACRQLGYTDGKVTTRDPRDNPAAVFGVGQGNILMDNVHCSGDETRLVDCQHHKTPNCFRFEEVNISCSNPVPNITTPSAISVPGNQLHVIQFEATIAHNRVDDLTWTIPGGTDGGADSTHFELTEDGSLSFMTMKNPNSPDDANMDGSYELNVKVADGEMGMGSSDTESFTIALLSADSDAPGLTSKDVEGSSLTLVYDEELDGGSVPATSAFTVKVDNVSREVNNVAVEGQSVILTLASPVADGEEVKLSYVKPTTDPIQDRAGNDAPVFSEMMVQVSDAIISRIMLVDSISDIDLLELSQDRNNPTTVDLSNYSIDEFGLRVDIADGVTVGSVFMELRYTSPNGAKWWRDQEENSEPYSLWGKRGGDIRGYRLPAGDYTFLARAKENKLFHGPNAVWIQVLVLDEVNLSFSVMGSTPRARATTPTQLTAEFDGFPDSHDGQTPFSFQIDFSEDITGNADDMRDHALSVSGGTVTSASRVDNRADLWSFTITPSGTENITISLLGRRACSEAGAICTSGDKELAISIGTLIPFISTPAAVVVPTPLTASFENMPASHDGSAFTFELLFSEEVSIGYATVRDDVLSVSEGTVTRATRKNAPSNMGWDITVTPSSDADVSIALSPTTDCTADGAVCTGDGKALSSSLSETVTGPLPSLTANFTDAPASHDGSTIFTVNLSFSEPVAVSYKVLRDQALSASNGTIRRCHRVNGRNDLWKVHIEPTANADVTVSLSATTDCAAADAVCTSDDRPLSNSSSETIAGPPLNFGLDVNYPNPFNPETQIAYTLSEAGPVELAIYNIMGQRVRTLIRSVQAAGRYQVVWDGRDDRGVQVSTGVYLSRLSTAEGVQVRRMLLLK